MRVEHLIAKSSQESLNVIEKWNGANSFMLYGKGGEIAAKVVSPTAFSNFFVENYHP
jgi:TnpA family transposase